MKMLTLKEFMELVDYRITEGSEYYINNMVLYSLDSWSGEHNSYSFSIVFDPKNDQRVYMVEACDVANNRAYRLVDPSLTPDNRAWDDVKWTTLEVDDDFIQKALAIKAGEDYDTRVSVPVDFTDAELLKYMTLAHEQDITFNQLVERALREAIDRDKK